MMQEPLQKKDKQGMKGAGKEEESGIGGNKRPEKSIQPHEDGGGEVEEDASSDEQETGTDASKDKQWERTFKKDDCPTHGF